MEIWDEDISPSFSCEISGDSSSKKSMPSVIHESYDQSTAKSENRSCRTSARTVNYDNKNSESRDTRERNTWNQNERSKSESSEMLVDNSFVGKIIGKGGSKIKEIQKESGAYIKVLRNDTGSGDTSIRLSGSYQAIEAGKRLIEELISGHPNLSTKSDFMRDTSSDGYKSPYEQPVIDWAKLLRESDEYESKKLAALPPIKKDFYHEDPEVAAMTPEEVKEFRINNNSISVKKIAPGDDRSIPNPVISFKHAFHHYPELLNELHKQGFTSPSPIQSQAWPILMKGNDMIGIAQTGTGKTIAFLFPAFIHLIGQVTPREKRVGPSVLILAPTRELAQQIEAEAKKYTYHGIRSICIYGGGSRRNQINIVTTGVDIVIATPGRLNDLVMNGIIDVTGVSYLVLDEADRMLDLGFEPQIRKIVIDIRSDRQTVMTSATWTGEIQELATRYMTKPFRVNVGALDLAAVHTVTQEIIFGSDDYDERRELLDEFIMNMGADDKAIVFVDRKCIADDIASDLIRRGIHVQSIHGDREQCDREQALNDLKTGYVKVLIATDVASRGIDIKDITLIFNLFFPRNIEEYVHRVGRTGRAGKTGRAISVITRHDWMHAAGLIKILEEANQYVPDELYDMAERYSVWKAKKTAEERAAGGRRRGRNRF